MRTEEAEAAEEDDVDVLVIELFSVQRLPSIQVHDRTVVQYYFDCLQCKFAENGMVVVQAQVGYVHLGVGRIARRRSQAARDRLVELLSDLKEAGLDLLFYLWTQLLFRVVHLHLLLLEVLQQVGGGRLRSEAAGLLFAIARVILVDRLLDHLDAGVHRVVVGLPVHTDHRQGAVQVDRRFQRHSTLPVGRRRAAEEVLLLTVLRRGLSDDVWVVLLVCLR